MTSHRYRITVTGLIGPTLRSAFSEFEIHEIARHHVLLVPHDAPDTLLTVLHRLEEREIEVEQATAQYR